MLHVLFHFTFRVIKEVTVTFLHHTRLDHYNPLPGFLHDKNHHSKNIATTHLDCLSDWRHGQRKLTAAKENIRGAMV